MVEEDFGGEGVIWNFDDAMGKLVFSMKVDFIQSHKEGNFEKAYWSLFYLLSEIEPLFDETPRKELNKEFDTISEQRVSSQLFNDWEDEEEKNNCYSLMITLYRKLCDEMVEKGLYFRKKKGYTGL
jgi:hypothetical protein